MTNIRIPLMRSTFFEEEQTKQKLADFILKSSRLSMGEHCAQFEREFAAFQERKYAVLVSNGSTANLDLIQSLINLGRLKRGDKVGVSALTWATNVMPLMQLGLVPVAIDCSVDHLNVTADELKKHINDLQAFFITNVLGFCGDIDAIKNLCDEHHVILIEDNCESLGTRYKEKLLGNYGIASTCSFFVGHHLSTIEGGIICTDDEELYHMMVMVRAHGWDRSLPVEMQKKMRAENHVDDFHARYTFYESAYNLRPTEITGFLGSVQLPMLEGTIQKREANFKRFHTAVSKRTDIFYPFKADHIERVSNFAMPVVTRSADVLADMINRFEKAGVEIRPVIAGNIAAHPFWKKALGSVSLPNADLVHAQGFYFPNNPELTSEEVDLLCTLVEASA